MDDEPRVTDVTEEVIGARRADWRDGFDSGLRTGARRVIESQTLEQVVIELKLLRVLYAAACDALADAQYQITVLEAELDYRAPGWDEVRH